MRTLPGLVALLAGCAGADPGLRAADPPHAAAATGVDRADLTFTSRDGLALYAQRWRPRTGEPRAVVVIHHGLADHSDRYAAFAERLVHAGYAVWGVRHARPRPVGFSVARMASCDRLARLHG